VLVTLLVTASVISPDPGVKCAECPGTVIRYTSRGNAAVIWNQTWTRDTWGQRRYLARPDSEWMRRDDPALRIVPEAPWQSEHQRLTGTQKHLTKATGGRQGTRDVDSKYLLSGFARCASCGDSL
jgi:hypothetical protein